MSGAFGEARKDDAVERWTDIEIGTTDAHGLRYLALMQLEEVATVATLDWDVTSEGLVHQDPERIDVRTRIDGGADALLR